MSRSPIIGITADFQTSEAYAKTSWYALRHNYAECIAENCGIPVILPCNIALVHEYFNMLDGLIISGGDFDIDPSYYDEPILADSIKINDYRTKFEIALLRLFLDSSKPILGICGGMQLINVVHGGSLIQDIIEFQGSSFHMQSEEKHIPTHSINVAQNSMLYKIVKNDQYSVNSTHHQAVKRIGENLIATATADDGIIEAIESVNHRFCLGIQWHPEFLCNPYDIQIFKAMIQKSF